LLDELEVEDHSLSLPYFPYRHSGRSAATWKLGLQMLSQIVNVVLPITKFIEDG